MKISQQSFVLGTSIFWLLFHVLPSGSNFFCIARDSTWFCIMKTGPRRQQLLYRTLGSTFLLMMAYLPPRSPRLWGSYMSTGLHSTAALCSLLLSREPWGSLTGWFVLEVGPCACMQSHQYLDSLAGPQGPSDWPQSTVSEKSAGPAATCWCSCWFLIQPCFNSSISPTICQ